jgi:3-carboxy-cis,cis-muconate cycloisomerase
VALGCELGLLVGSLGKIAKDISLMGQYEVGELAEPSEPGRGGSSAMPHKRNPVACMVALAAAQRAPQRVAALLAAMPQEHERALGNWQAELAEWPGLLMSAQGSARAMAQALAGLQVDTQRMRANLDDLRAALPPEAADEWFSPALAQHAAELTHTQVSALTVLNKQTE